MRRMSAGVQPLSRSERRLVSRALLASLRPCGVRDQAMVVIERRRQIEQHLQQPVQVGRRIEVAPARDVRDALPGIVDDHGQVIAGGHVLAHDHRIAPALGAGLDRARRAVLAELGEGERGAAELGGRSRDGGPHVDA